MEQEIRQFNVEFKACSNDKKRTISGRAIPFNVFSPNREGFREMISPEAVEGVIECSDIFMLYNHDKSKGFLARKNNKRGKGSLSIEVKEDGVYFEFNAKNDNLSNYIYERVESGELDEMSFAFTSSDEEWKKADDGVYERIIKKFGGIYDFSIVDNSYYGIEDAVGCKRFAELQEADRIALEEAQKAEEERLAAEKAEQEKREAEEEAAKLAEYYSNLKETYKDYINNK